MPSDYSEDGRKALMRPWQWEGGKEIAAELSGKYDC